jgi:hypothetical protein
LQNIKHNYAIFKTVRSLGRSPEDVEDFKDFLNSLDFFATFLIKQKSRKEKKWNTHIHLAKHFMLKLSTSEEKSAHLQTLSETRHLGAKGL